MTRAAAVTRPAAVTAGIAPPDPLGIFLASDFYHPHIGGAERQVMLLARALIDRGHRVRVATPWQPGLREAETIDGVPVARIRTVTTSVPWFSGDAQRRFLPPAPDPALVVGLRRLLRRFRPDVVHANGWIAYSSAAATSGGGAALVISARDYGYACATRTLLLMDRAACSGPEPLKCLRCAGHHYGAVKGAATVAGVYAGRPLLGRTVRGVHSVSRFVESAVRRDLADGPRWESVVFERIPDIVVAPAEHSLTGEERELADRLPVDPFILFVGALRAHKGLDVLLRAYRRLERPPRLVLIGTRWKDTPIDFPPTATVLFDVPHSVVMEAWRRASFGVAPSIWADPLPGVVREGMVSSRAVIGSRIGGIPDMIEDGVNGLLVEPGDDGALASAMARLLADPALAKRLGEAARRSVADLGPEAIADRFEAFYRRVSAGR